MRGDRAAFMRAIIAAPDDDLPRLIFADWLDEQGEPEWAEFIRVQCELAAITDEQSCERDYYVSIGCSCRGCALRRREREIWFDSNRKSPFIAKTWFPIGGLTSDPYLSEDIQWHWYNDTADISGDMRRGFVEEITCSWDDWQAHAAAIMAATPLRRVRLITMPEHNGFIFYGTDGWRTHHYPGITFDLPHPVDPRRAATPMRVG